MQCQGPVFKQRVARQPEYSVRCRKLFPKQRQTARPVEQTIAFKKQLVYTQASVGAAASGNELDQEPQVGTWAFPLRIPVTVAPMVAMYYAIQQLSTSIQAVTLLSSYALWFGMTIWVSFVAGVTMIKNMEKMSFGRIQSKLFPKYFTLSTVCLTLMHGCLQCAEAKTGVPKMITWSLIGAVLSWCNWVLLGPFSTSVMFKRYRLVSQDDVDPADDRVTALKKEFGKFHGISQMINFALVVIMFYFTYAFNKYFFVAL